MGKIFFVKGERIKMLDRNYYFEYDVIPCSTFSHEKVILDNNKVIVDWLLNSDYRNIKINRKEDE